MALLIRPDLHGGVCVGINTQSVPPEGVGAHALQSVLIADLQPLGRGAETMVTLFASYT